MWPATLPVDGVQPWEQTDAAGHIKPAPRAAKSATPSAFFASGAESFTTGGTTAPLDKALRLDTGTAGSRALSYATYRLPLAGIEPGVVSLDVNLRTAASSYYVGLSDYAANHWVWRGPFTDHYIRLGRVPGQLDSSNYLSPLGNLFVAVVTYDGSAVDVVGVGANPLSDGDPADPDPPGTPVVTPAPGGLLLEWSPSAAADLAGYNVLWSSSSFAAATDSGVQSYSYCVDGGRVFLPLPALPAFVALQAIDIAGHTSPLTAVQGATPLTGDPPPLVVVASAPSALLDAAISLTATGANSYDFDLDGDGVYDLNGSLTGFASADTSHLGVLRLSVRGHGTDSQSLALGGVSLLISANTPPTVSASATPQLGDAPLAVQFTALAQDAEDPPAALTLAWDFDGDGIYEPGTNTLTPQHTYATVGVFNATVRVADTNGGSATATVPITVNQPLFPPVAHLTVTAQQQILPLLLVFTLDGSQSLDPQGGALVYDWDYEGDGTFDVLDGPALLTHTYGAVGTYHATLRVTNTLSLHDTATVPVYVPSIWSSHGGQPGAFTRQSPVAGAQTNAVRWSYATGNVVYASATLGADGTVYVGSCDDQLYALVDNGSATPTVKWTYLAGGLVESSVALGADGTVYFGSSDGVVYALADNGTATPDLKWSYTTGNVIESSPTVGPDGTVYIGSYDHNVYALVDNGTTTPTVKWSFTTGKEVGSSPAIGPDGTVYVGSYDRKVYALVDNGTATPSLKWSYTTANGIGSSPALGPDGTVYIGSDDNTVYALVDNGSTTPTVKWKFQVSDSFFSSPAVGADGTVYIGNYDKHVYALRDNGTLTPTVKWSFSSGDQIWSSPAIGADGTVYVGSYNGKIYALADNGTVTPTVKWSYATGNAVLSSPAIGADGTVYIGSYDNSIYAFGP